MVLVAAMLASSAEAQTWTNVPGWWGLMGYCMPAQVPSPELKLAGTNNNFTLSWPIAASNFVLETATSLTPPLTWTAAPMLTNIVGDQTTVTLPATNNQQMFRLKGPDICSIPIFQFQIFYNGLLELTWHPFPLSGRVHANGDIFVGSAWPLTFNSTVTCTGSILMTNWNGVATNAVTYHGNPGYVTNTPFLQLPIGMDNTPDAMREIINIPPIGEDPNSPMGQQRYFNKAQIVILVSNSTVTATLKTSPSDPSPITMVTTSPDLFMTFPFLSITSGFIDLRENKMIRVTQIDVGLYKNWLVTNSSVTAKFPIGSGFSPTILYVADNRTIVSSELTAIRLSNATVIPTNDVTSGEPTGWTLATPNPLYVWGNYNCPDASSLGTTNTSQTFPASLVSDALTILSPSWSDTNSLKPITSRKAASLTINAAIITGVVYSTGPGASQFSGGVQNLPRLLEDWYGDTLTLNTSMVNVFSSARATNQYVNPSTTYNPPTTRQFSFDQNFMNPSKLPPGTPQLSVIVPAG